MLTGSLYFQCPLLINHFLKLASCLFRSGLTGNGCIHNIISLVIGTAHQVNEDFISECALDTFLIAKGL